LQALAPKVALQVQFHTATETHLAGFHIEPSENLIVETLDIGGTHVELPFPMYARKFLGSWRKGAVLVVPKDMSVVIRVRNVGPGPSPLLIQLLTPREVSS
jgi:hypothetical protein